MMTSSLRETVLAWHHSFVDKMKEGLDGCLVVCFWTLWKERNQRSFKSKEMFYQSLKLTFLCNLLSWVRSYVDGGVNP